MSKLSLKGIYKKFKRADYSLSDSELIFLINELELTAKMLAELGTEYSLATKALRADINILDGFKVERTRFRRASH